MINGISGLSFGGVALVAIVFFSIRFIRHDASASLENQLWLEIKKIDWELDCLVDWYWGAILSTPSPEISKKAIRQQFIEEKEQLPQQKRRLEKKLNEIELRG